MLFCSWSFSSVGEVEGVVGLGDGEVGDEGGVEVGYGCVDGCC